MPNLAGEWNAPHPSLRATLSPLSRGEGVRGALLVAILAIAAAAQSQQYQEKITVERILIDARVTDSRGNPITGLTPADFRVLIDDKPAKVESADWIPETAAARELVDIDRVQPEVNTSLDVPAPPGRLFIFFFQPAFSRNST